MSFLFHGPPSFSSAFESKIREEFPDMSFYHRIEDVSDPKNVRYIGTWDPPGDVGTRFPNLQMIISLGAGADQFVHLALPERVKIVRIVASSITLMVRDYTMLGILALHRELPRFLDQRKTASSEPGTVVPASRRNVGIMGLGQTGLAVVEMLKVFGFPIYGWSRSMKDIEGVTTFSGPNGLQPFLSKSDILVCLLPLTDETQGLLDANLFSKLPKGAGLVHVGRGKQLDNAALLASLHDGHLSAAFVDVTDPEPLPATHPFWSEPKIILTPHIAAQTDPLEAARAAVNAVSSHVQGKPVRGMVDRTLGY